MEITQYLSPREYRETDKATAELNSFMLELFKDEKKLVIFDKDILLSEYDDSVPKWSKTKRTKKSKVIESIAVTMETPIAEVHALLDSLQERLADNIKDAELYYPINVELFSSVRKIKAVIDWLDLRFTVDPTMCKFYKEPNARSRIKELITKRTGIRHYIAHKDNHITQHDASFTIRLHDIRNKSDLKKITDLLVEEYGAKCETMTIDAIELSLDFYGGDGSAIVIKLHKAMQYPVDARLLRTYKTKWTRRDIPTAPHALYELVENGYNIGMGDHRSDVFCVRAYFKRTDKGGQSLSKDQHRARIEVTLTKLAFTDDTTDLHISNLRKIITCGFKKMQFTKLSKRATLTEKDQYYTQVKPFGKEQEDKLSISRHKRNLPDAIESYAWLNEAKRNAVKDLARKF
ncbi:hypothetical protein [Acinetobacter sp. 197]|uniref:hypothetical protein n=1 Tax=Acinetobacter sp. 197 TaxID=3114696 RepID=UPI003A8AD7E8